MQSKNSTAYLYISLKIEDASKQNLNRKGDTKSSFFAGSYFEMNIFLKECLISYSQEWGSWDLYVGYVFIDILFEFSHCST